MQAYYRDTSRAPYSTCPKCGWSGKDWGFKYRSLCKRCHAQWRTEKAEENRKYKAEHKPIKLPNENMEVAAGIIVTRNVKDRLRRQAVSDVPSTRKSQLAGMWEGISLSISGLAMLMLLITIFFQLEHTRYVWILMVSCLAVSNICKRIEINERKKQIPEVNTRLEELARERQRKIDETNAFYASSEWRLVRGKVIQEQGRVCQACGSRITIDCDLTVDHIKPRSKFPELALDKSNLQVLCRRCNSTKGATYDEASIRNQATASF